MRLYLLRHARAEIGSDDTPDEARALTEDGHREAADVASWLAGRTEPPTHVLCSSARRAVETMECVVAAIPDKPAVSVSDELYLASAWKLFEQIHSTQTGVSSLMLVGHNPGMAELAVKLARRGDAALMSSLARRFPPASLAEVELDGPGWSDAEPEGGTLVSHFVA